MNKKALIAQSVIMLVMVLTLFVTATYAWFIPALGFINKIETNVIEKALSVKIYRYNPTDEERGLGNSSMDVFEQTDRDGYKLMYDSSQTLAKPDEGISGVIPNVSGFYKIEILYIPRSVEGDIPIENSLQASVNIDFIDITGNKVYNENRDIITRAIYIQIFINNAYYNEASQSWEYGYYSVSREGGGTRVDRLDSLDNALKAPKYSMYQLMNNDEGTQNVNIGDYTATQGHKLTVYYNYSVENNDTIGTEFNIEKYRFTVR